MGYSRVKKSTKKFKGSKGSSQFPQLTDISSGLSFGPRAAKYPKSLSSVLLRAGVDLINNIGVA